MQPALDSNTLDRLISLGRQQGQLTTEDLRASLPIESMNADEIALVVVHLEETGIPVELEESLLSPGSGPVQRQSAEIIPFPVRSATPRPNPHTFPLQPAPPPHSHAIEPETQVRDGVHWLVAAFGLLVLVAIGIVFLAWGM